MDAELFILTTLNDACRKMALDDLSWPTWTDAQFLRTCALRQERGDVGWQKLQERIDSSCEFCAAMCMILIKQGVVNLAWDGHEVSLNLPVGTRPLETERERHFLQSLHLPKAEIDTDSWLFPLRHASTVEIERWKRFTPPAAQPQGEIMYVERKPGLAGLARIGRVRFSKTRKTIYYNSVKLQSLKGAGYKANYYDVETRMRYWVSKCRKDGNDALYPATIEIDDDAREEYWTRIRQQPDKSDVTKFRAPGKYAKRTPR